MLQSRQGVPYLYRTRREGSRVVREHVASGPTALAIHAVEARERAARRAALAGARDDAAASDREARRVVAAGDRAVAATLESLGWHRPKRSWRRRRGATMNEIATTTAGAEVRRAEKVQRGFLAEMVEGLVIAAEADGDAAMADRIRAEVEAVRSDLAGPDPTPIERLLADRCAATYLDIQLCDMRCQVAKSRGLDAAVRAVLDRRRDGAHKRYLSSLAALARVRRLAVPALQFHGPSLVKMG